MNRRLIVAALAFGVWVSLQGCSGLIASQTGKMADSLSSAIYNSDDIESVGQAIPTFLVLIDGMIESSPDNADLLVTGAQLNDAYAGVFVEDAQRAQKLSSKSMDYAWRAMCAHDKAYCDWPELGHEEFKVAVAGLDAKDLPYAYTLGVSWLNWIRNNSDDWNALAQLARPEQVLNQVLVLDDEYENGMAHLYVGALATLLPPALGGKPEEGRRHFERAIEISQERNMMAKVVFAEQYARLVFDRELHHQLLTEVVDGDPDIEGYVLLNTVAQQEAHRLLADEAEYF